MMRGYKYESKISVVPIINVSLVIVLALMLIAPFLNDIEQPVDLPEAKASEVDDTDNVEITFTLEKEIFIHGQKVQMEEVRPTLAALFSGVPNAVVIVKADKALLYGDVESLIAEVEAAEAPRIAIATRHKTGEGSE
jgi:biopolymer transport protein ExbD